MKKFYSIVAAGLFSATVCAQTTIYSESMGSGTGTSDISTNTFQNGSPVTYDGTGDVRSTNPSTTGAYAQASGGANVMINASNETFLISGINTTVYQNIQLYFGQRKGTTAANNELKVEVSADGNSWTSLSYSRATGSNTANWLYINPSGTIPATSNLRIRFTGTNSTEWRIDDVKLTGTSGSLATADTKKTKNVFVKNTSVDQEIYFGEKAEVKIFNMSGQLVKAASVSENGSLNVENLQSGIYMVTGNINGKGVTEKIVKK